MRGQGCTLAEKGTYLNRPEREVTTAGLATYDTLRLFLSFLLFGSFDLSWLLRSNYERFLTALGSSEFCAFLPLFRESVYWTYFKK